VITLVAATMDMLAFAVDVIILVAGREVVGNMEVMI
jgi:hypothetical protein